MRPLCYQPPKGAMEHIYYDTHFEAIGGQISPGGLTVF